MAFAGDGEQAATLVSGKLEEIVQGTSRVSETVSRIAAAAGEQIGGIEQVNRAVAEMERVTQQNAASAQESSSAAAELSQLAQELTTLVATFRLEQEGAPVERVD